MKQFLLLLGVAAVAGAMYVAGASGSQQSKFASKKQVAALQKKVTSLTKELKATVKPEADFSASYLLSCLLTLDTSNNTLSVNLMPVSEFGNATSGFLFGNVSTSTPRSALDVNTTSPTALLQEINPSCLSGGGLRHGALRSDGSRLRLWMSENGR